MVFRSHVPGKVLTPAERRTRNRGMMLCLLSGTLLGLSFPPFPLGVLACVGLVPLLVALEEIDRVRDGFFRIYSAFLVFHVITLNWTGGFEHMNDGYMMIAGTVTMVLHPLFYLLPVAGYLLVRGSLGRGAALVSLPAFWVAYEYSHSLSEWSFPWLTIGNSQSYDPARLQFISVTGVYGLSLWILVVNVLIFALSRRLVRPGVRLRDPMAMGTAGAILLLYLLPTIHGTLVLSDAPDPVRAGGLEAGARTVRVGMVQSNIDPWQKWQRDPVEAIRLYMHRTRALAESTGTQKPDLVLWPETAVTYYLLTPAGAGMLDAIRSDLGVIGVPVLTGVQHAVFYDDSTEAPPSAKRARLTGQRYDTFNAAAFIQPGVDEVPWYGKMRMVPIAERVPYADAFYWLDFLRWGVGIGGWQIGPDTVLFAERKTGARFCTMICYESTFPGFVAAFVRKGAEFIAVITIDSWWGRMSGAFQHHQFAVFRAVENRRWIARCAVGGMSSYIDPYGRVYDRTELFSEAALLRTIGRSTDTTFYTRHGDWLGQLCAFAAGLFLAAVAGRRFLLSQGGHQP